MTIHIKPASVKSLLWFNQNPAKPKSTGIQRNNLDLFLLIVIFFFSLSPHTKFSVVVITRQELPNIYHLSPGFMFNRTERTWDL